MIKVISGIRRCGKSFFLKSIIGELLKNGINEKDIIYIELDKKGYKDIKTSNKIKDKALFERIDKFVINNFGAVISIKNIYNYLKDEVKVNVDRRTIKRYLDILEKAKIIYSCDLFDIKSKSVLKGEKKYYLADLSIYYSQNTDNRINYGPILENVMYSYLKSKNLYSLMYSYCTAYFINYYLKNLLIFLFFYFIFKLYIRVFEFIARY